MPSSRQDFERIREWAASPRATEIVPEWLNWDEDGRMAAVDAAQELLGARGHGIVKWADVAEAIRQAVRAYNTKVIEDAGCQVCGARGTDLEWVDTPFRGWLYACADVLTCSRHYRSVRNEGRRRV